MNYPQMQEIPSSRTATEVWQGYNHQLRIGDGELYDMENMSSDLFPILAPRKIRGIYAEPDNAQGLVAKDNVCYVDGRDFVIDGFHIDLKLSTRAEDCPKQLISMGAYVIIMPDKMYVNTADLTDYGKIEAGFTTDGNVDYSICKLDGEDYDIDNKSPTEPENPVDGQLWLDTSSKPNILKQWSESNAMWTQIATTYIKITHPGIGAAFKEFDGVTIHGLKDAEDPDIAAIDGSFVLWGVGNNHIIIVGMLANAQTLSLPVTIERKMPIMDYICESNNRLWGCRYGTNWNGDIVNEIYCSKLGDFKNWNVFLGIASDSYAASVGSDGHFTGCIAHLGYPLFFKENAIHKVYGQFPSNFQIQTTTCRGVQRGSWKSLAIVNEVLFYKSRTGVCAYDGSLPQEISEQLGDIHYQDAVGGGHGNKYYISMHDDDGLYSLFVYDTVRRLWHREDDAHVRDWCSSRNEMYFIDCADGKIKTVGGSGDPAEDNVNWMAATGMIGLETPDNKYLTKITIRMSMNVGAVLRAYVEYDSTGIWESVCQIESSMLRSFTLPIRCKRTDHIRIKFEGSGDVRIFSIAKTLEAGSDVNDHSGQMLDF